MTSYAFTRPGGVALHLPQEQKTWVMIPPGYKIFRETQHWSVYIIDLCIIYLFKNKNKGIVPLKNNRLLVFYINYRKSYRNTTIR
jgi:hypothetical protein